jgi:tetratricopeptide (TPR) repeat protein
VRLLRSFLLAAPLAILPALALAGDPPAPTSSASAAASAAPAASALAELPRLPPIPAPEPDPGALRELDRLLERLTSEDDRSRTDARAALAEVTPAIVPAIHHRVQDLRSALDRDEAPRVLEAARKAGRKASKKGDDAKEPKASKKGDDAKDAKEPKASKKGDDAKDAKEPKKSKKEKAHKDEDDADSDWLDFLLASPHPKDKTWGELVRLYGMTRMLSAVGSTPAVREMVQLYAHFGELVRIDLQRQVAKLRDRAVPALIEARQHDAKSVQKWANKELDALGRAIPGEAVASNDPQVLADVLRAYGRTRDVDAVRVILSFCNSDRVQLREAAREAVAAIGEPGVWQVRDQYLGLTGEKPPRAWAWDRLAREVFGLYDKQRLAEIHKLMDEGVAAAGASKVVEAVDAFDKVLARAPLFERRREMVPTYVERAKQLEDGHREDALAMMRKALRLDPKGDRSKPIAAEIAYLEGELSIEQGSPDKTAFERALSLAPTHEGARKALASLEDKAVERQSHLQRYAAAAGIGVAALLAMILLARRKPSGGGPAAPAEPLPPPPAPLPEA